MKILQNAGRKASLRKYLGNMLGNGRCLGRGLQYDGVACKESRDERIDQDQIRVL